MNICSDIERDSRLAQRRQLQIQPVKSLDHFLLRNSVKRKMISAAMRGKHVDHYAHGSTGRATTPEQRHTAATRPGVIAPILFVESIKQFRPNLRRRIHKLPPPIHATSGTVIALQPSGCIKRRRIQYLESGYIANVRNLP